MFTGIIEEVGNVVGARGGELRVRAKKVLRQTKPGDSIAVDGVDLTVTAIVDRVLRFDVMLEPLSFLYDRRHPFLPVSLHELSRP